MAVPAYHGEFTFAKSPAEITAILQSGLDGVGYRISSQSNELVVWERKRRGVLAFLFFGWLAMSSAPGTVTATYHPLEDGTTRTVIDSTNGRLGPLFEELRSASVS